MGWTDKIAEAIKGGEDAQKAQSAELRENFLMLPLERRIIAISTSKDEMLPADVAVVMNSIACRKPAVVIEKEKKRALIADITEYNGRPLRSPINAKEKAYLDWFYAHDRGGWEFPSKHDVWSDLALERWKRWPIVFLSAFIAGELVIMIDHQISGRNWKETIVYFALRAFVGLRGLIVG